MSGNINQFYNTGCAPRNVFLAWSTLAIVSTAIALVQVMRKKRNIGLTPEVTVAELAVALVVSIALVVIVSYILKGLCTTEAGWWVGFVVVAGLVGLTSYGCADFYTNQLTVREVALARRVRDKLPNLRARFSRKAAPVAAQVAAPVRVAEPVSASSSDIQLPAMTLDSPTSQTYF